MATASGSADRRTQALTVARELVDDLEAGVVAIAQNLMKAQRLARLLRDSDAQRWLDLESRGYPETMELAQLGSCAKYAHRALIGDGPKVFRTSLPALEAQVEANRSVLDKLKAPTAAKTANFTELRSTQQLHQSVSAQIANASDALTNAVAIYERMKSHLYRFAADTLIALEFGDVAEDLFQSARQLTDAFIRDHAPKAAEQLLAANDRLLEGTDEALSASLTSCRRVLNTVADSLFPAQADEYVGSDRKSRKVGADQYNNRLLAYADARIESGSTKQILKSQLGHLAARLDAVYDKACKGVHADVTVEEARMVMIQTYLFLAELARLHASASAEPQR
ncbi:hypothetical protein ACQ859_11005 [Roseateles chitinivorans]|uniref:AbiTii domain-containing protein n=1 Tax=Roseateles chitinivorans TaxID=2917965 RepID=UPI003D665F37